CLEKTAFLSGKMYGDVPRGDMARFMGKLTNEECIFVEQCPIPISEECFHVSSECNANEL
ncbi:MAG TPA: hypothetical protein PK215_06230, partial [Clostridiales bacterium]|nr:hypothetical protein [Clostridiales bacterium]